MKKTTLKIRNFVLASALMLIGLTALPGNAVASICGPCSMDGATDAFERVASNAWNCRADWAGFFNRGMGIHEVDFSGGWGWTDECNDVKPLKRAHNALYLLYRSVNNYATRTADFSGNISRWGGNYALREHTDFEGHCAYDFDGLCSKGGVLATADGSGQTRAYVRFFGHTYGGQLRQMDVLDRAAAIIHESRHHHDFSIKHNSKEQDLSWAQNGAYKYQAIWLAFYGSEANRNTNLNMRRRALARANALFVLKFQQRPNVRAEIAGLFYASDGSPL